MSYVVLRATVYRATWLIISTTHAPAASMADEDACWYALVCGKQQLLTILYSMLHVTLIITYYIIYYLLVAKEFILLFVTSRVYY